MLNRKDFLIQIGATGLVATVAPCCAAAAELSAAEGTPIDRRMTFAQTWAKRMMDNVDAELDETTRKRLLQANGRACFLGSNEHNQFQGGVDAFIEQIRKWVKGGPMPIRREGDVVYFDYTQNPAGLKVADGWCLCPLVERGPAGLSGTFCECSVGYVRQMFTEIACKPVRVELLESLKRGGRGCRFRIDLA